MVGIRRILHIQLYLAAAIGVLPVLPYLGSWVMVVLGTAAPAGIWADATRRQLLPERLGTLLSLAFFLLFLSRVSLANPAPPLIEFLCLLLAVRLVGQKSGRHILQIFLLASIILAASSMLTLGQAYLAYLVFMIVLVTSGLILLSFYVTDPHIRLSRKDWRQLLKTAAILPAGSLSLMLLFFVILPRTQTPLWNFLTPSPKATTGMSDKVRPGSVVDLSGDDSIAFRAETAHLPDSSLYWRGIVFDQIQGQTWQRSSAAAREHLVTAPASEHTIRFFTEPRADSYLPGLDRSVQVTATANNRIWITADGTLQTRGKGQRKASYQIRAQLDARSLLLSGKERYLTVPDRVSQRVAAIGSQLRQTPSFDTKIARLNRFFRDQQLSYSATRLPQTADPVDTFLFVSRRGYCEYFASSYATLLRLAGVPTRLVGGYLGGEYNRFGGYYLVREDQAHVWVEALNDAGVWERIDPSRLAVNSSAAFRTASSAPAATLRSLLDLLEHNWTRLVLNYDLRSQFDLLRSLTRNLRSLKQVEPGADVYLPWLALLLVPVLFGTWRLRRQPRSTRILKRYLKLTAACFGSRSLPAATGLFALAEQVRDPLCREFATIYGGAVYRDRTLSRQELDRLDHIVHQLSRKRHTLTTRSSKPPQP